MADEPRNARVRDDARRQHRIGRRQQRAEQERLRPREVGERVRGERDERGGDRHRQHELARRQPPRRCSISRLDLEPVAEQDHDQRDGRELLDEARLGVELEHAEARRRRARTRRPRTPPSSTGSCGGRARPAARPRSAGRRRRAWRPRTRSRRRHRRQRTLHARCATPLPCRSGSTAHVRPRRRRSRATSRPTSRSSAAASPVCGRPCRPSRSGPQREVVLLEAEAAGWGASGRNGGFVDASLTHGLPTAPRASRVSSTRSRRWGGRTSRA